jgi:hypothetical protein
VLADNHAQAVAVDELSERVVGIVAVLGIDTVGEPFLGEPAAVVVNNLVFSRRVPSNVAKDLS